MAVKHNFLTQGPLSQYNAQGEVKWANSKDELTQIQQEGFRSNYVRSKYPTTAFNRKTGQSKPVGKIGDTDEQVAAKLAAFGSDWTFDHVPEPEPVKETKAESAGMDIQALLSIMADVALMKSRISDLETAAIQAEEIRIGLASRVGELEGLIEEPPPPSNPTITPSKVTVTTIKEAIAPVGAGKK